MSSMKDILSRFDSAHTASSAAVDSQNTESMKSILMRLTVAESLDSQQKSVDQLSATFKPKTTPVLTAKKDPKNPMAGKLVGSCEEEKAVAEDILAQVKQGLADYLKGLDQKPQDSHIFKQAADRDIGSRVKIDRDLIPQKDPVKHAREVVLTQSPVKTIKLDDVTECGIYGDETAGFEIRRGDRVLPTRFKALDQAIAAAELFAARRRQDSDQSDYREEK